MNPKNTIMVAPVNDAEAVLILKISKAIGLATIISVQPHGATLDKEPKIIEKIKKSGAQNVVIVEMPGIKTEEKIAKFGFKIKIIDHHHYQNLNRKKIKSSLEQFLDFFKLMDIQLSKFGFQPKLVRGIGILDRGFVGALRQEGYSETEIKKIFSFQKLLMRPFVDPIEEKKNEKSARVAWAARKKWQEFYVVSGYSKKGLRPYLANYLALRFKTPASLIIVERGRNVIMVQDSSVAEKLFKKFGGFTFGEKGNWGYKNQPGRKKVTLEDVKREIIG